MDQQSPGAAGLLSRDFTSVTSWRVVEEWVNRSVGLTDRSRCFGKRAVELATRNLGVTITIDPALPIAGELRITRDGLVAYLSSHQNEARRNFTIAHELGHASLYIYDPKLDQANGAIERFCNVFAAELLMPWAYIGALNSNSRSFAHTLLLLAARSEASLSSASIRMAEYLRGGSGLADRHGKIMRQYGSIPDRLRVGEWLLRIARERRATFTSVRLGWGWTLEAAFLGRRHVFIVYPAPTANALLSAAVPDRSPVALRADRPIAANSGDVTRL